MNNRKLRFNVIDVLIILIIAAVIYVLLNVFVFNDSQNDNTAVNYKTIQYVVEVNNIDKRFSEVVKAGQVVQDAIEKKVIGTVTGVQSIQYKKSTFDFEELKEVVSAVEDRITLKITIEAEVMDTERAYIINGCEIRVGQSYSLILPDLYAVGYCVDLNDNQ